MSRSPLEKFVEFALGRLVRSSLYSDRRILGCVFLSFVHIPNANCKMNSICIYREQIVDEVQSFELTIKANIN